MQAVATDTTKKLARETKIVQCEWCGVEFPQSKHRKESNHRFCSARCRVKKHQSEHPRVSPSDYVLLEKLKKLYDKEELERLVSVKR